MNHRKVATPRPTVCGFLQSCQAAGHLDEATVGIVNQRIAVYGRDCRFTARSAEFRFARGPLSRY